MSIDRSTERTMFDGIRPHIGHDIEVVAYGAADDPANVAIECVTCGTVLLDADAPDIGFDDEQEAMKRKEDVATAEEARDLAIAWQSWMSEQNLSMGEFAEWADYFGDLAERFPELREEFEENAII